MTRQDACLDLLLAFLDLRGMTSLILELRKLTVNEILEAARQSGIEVPRAHQSPKEKLISWLSLQCSPRLEDIVQSIVTERFARRNERQREKRRRRAEEQRRRRQARRLEEHRRAEAPARDISKYLDLPDTHRLHDCYAAYYHATSNAAFRQLVCAVCARELGVRESQIKILPLQHLPHRERLVPRSPHREHTLFEGALLEPRGVVTQDEGVVVQVCRECLQSLEASGDNPPAMSLANDMWIGPVPWELEVLTLPEQMLIALLYPRVYVFKLYPRGRKVGPDGTAESLQRGMKGTCYLSPSLDAENWTRSTGCSTASEFVVMWCAAHLSG